MSSSRRILTALPTNALRSLLLALAFFSTSTNASAAGWKYCPKALAQLVEDIRGEYELSSDHYRQKFAIARLRWARIPKHPQTTPIQFTTEAAVAEAIEWARAQELTFPAALRKAVRTKSPHMYALASVIQHKDFPTETKRESPPTNAFPGFSFTLPRKFWNFFDYAHVHGAPKPVLLSLMNAGYVPSRSFVFDKDADFFMAGLRLGGGWVTPYHYQTWPKKWLHLVPALLDRGFEPSLWHLADWMRYSKFEEAVVKYLGTRTPKLEDGRKDFLAAAARHRRYQVLETALNLYSLGKSELQGALQTAIAQGDLKLLKMIEKRFQVEFEESDLLVAIQSGDPDIVRFVLERSAFPLTDVFDRVASSRNFPWYALVDKLSAAEIRALLTEFRKRRGES